MGLPVPPAASAWLLLHPKAGADSDADAALDPSRSSACSATCRPEVLAVRKKILSSRCGAAALRSGNSVPMVLPMPVGACASRQRAPLAARYTASASGRCPVRKSPNGKSSASKAASRAVRCASCCSAQARKRAQCCSKCSFKCCALHSSTSTVSCWLPMSRYTSATSSASQFSCWHSSQPYTLACAQCRWRCTAGWRSRLPLKVLTSSSRRLAGSQPSQRPRTRRFRCWPVKGTSLR